MEILRGKIVLIIDDDPDLLRLLERSFSQTGAQVCTALSGRDGLLLLNAYQPQLVVLDIMMPDMDGWEVCDRIRQQSDVPIIFLTALDEDEDIVRGLECGAVDYVTKPFSLEELLARARAAVRQPGPERRATYRDSYLTIDLDQRQVLVRGERVKLTKTEYRLLAHLLENADRVVSFQRILEDIWGPTYQDSVYLVYAYMWRLRSKLEEDPKCPRYLLTEHGMGYVFQTLALEPGSVSLG